MYGQGLDGKSSSRAEEGDTIGVLVERKKFGRVAFVKNGKYLGVAFEDKKLMEGQLYAALAPIYPNHEFTIVSPMPED
jgi:hypothetical protein